MLKPILSLVLISTIFIASCGGEKKEENPSAGSGTKNETSQIKITIENNIQPNSLADISITGMVCEVNCVGSVKKLLSAMIGVTEIEIDFNSENNVNHAMVKYDNKMVNDKQMVSAIEKLNDGAYKVGEVEVKKLDEKSAANKKKQEEKEITFTTPSGSGGFALPNILDVFNIL